MRRGGIACLECPWRQNGLDLSGINGRTTAILAGHCAYRVLSEFRVIVGQQREVRCPLGVCEHVGGCASRCPRLLVLCLITNKQDYHNQNNGKLKCKRPTVNAVIIES